MTDEVKRRKRERLIESMKARNEGRQTVADRVYAALAPPDDGLSLAMVARVVPRLAAFVTGLVELLEQQGTLTAEDRELLLAELGG